jgi:hypothetical protein
MQSTNGQLSSYTNDTWTDLISSPADIGNIIIANNHASTTITVELQRTNSGGTTLAQILPPVDFAPGDVQKLGALSVTGTQKIRVRCSAAGIHFDWNGLS